MSDSVYRKKMLEMFNKSQQAEKGPAVIGKALRRTNVTGFEYPTAQIIGYQTGLMTEQDILKGSLVDCSKTDLNSPLLGASSPYSVCAKCEKGSKTCTGHAGRIHLNYFIYNPLFISTITKILRLFNFESWLKNQMELVAKVGKSYNCAHDPYRVDIGDLDREIDGYFDVEMVKQRYSNLTGTDRLNAIEKHAMITDKKEGEASPISYVLDLKHPGFIKRKVEKENLSSYVNPLNVKRFFCALESYEIEVGEDDEGNKQYKKIDWVDIIGFGSNTLSSMVMEEIPVAAVTVRLNVSEFDSTMKGTNALNTSYDKLISANAALKVAINTANKKDKNDTIRSSFVHAFNVLNPESPKNKKEGNNTKASSKNAPQTPADHYSAVYTAFYNIVRNDSSVDNVSAFAQNTIPKGHSSIFSLLKGKSGFYRKNLLAKRGSHRGRGVIVGDQDINPDVVGIPRSFEDVITIPEEIETDEDIQYWTMQLPKKNGDKTSIVSLTKTYGRIIPADRLADHKIVIGDIVKRRLMEGDVAIVTRQPIFHKPSMMGMKVQFNKDGDQNIRINLAVASAYNADFDGDEMNIVFVQSKAARNEVLENMMVEHCIRGDQSSKPVMSLIQNTILAANTLTSDIDPLTRDEVVVQKHVMQEMFDKARFDLPENNPNGAFATSVEETMLRAKKNGIPPNSGKAAFSMFLPKNFFYKKMKGNNVKVQIRNGILVKGSLAKSDVGSASRGIIDTMLEQMGPKVVIAYLGVVQRGIIYWLQHYRGYTLGLSDCFLGNKDSDKEIQNITNMMAEQVEEVYNLSELSSSKPTKTELTSIENKVIEIITQARDKIAKIVNGGGWDMKAIEMNLIKEEDDKEIQEMLKRMKVDYQTVSWKVKRSDEEHLNVIKDLQLLAERYSSVSQTPENDEAFQFSAENGLSGDNLRDRYAEILQKMSKLREDVIKSANFRNNFLHIISVGAKGTPMDKIQVSGSVGDQKINGKRLARNLADGQKLTHYHRRGSNSPLATGYCQSNFAKGLSLEEFIYHGIAARSSMISSNMMPGVSGYFFRRLYLKLGSKVADASGRIRQGKRIISFAHGKDKMDPTKIMLVQDVVQGYDNSEYIHGQPVDVMTFLDTI